MPPEFSDAAHRAAEKVIAIGLERGWSHRAIASNALDAACQQRKLEESDSAPTGTAPQEAQAAPKPDVAERCQCSHTRHEHSFDRADDYQCRQCPCPGFAPVPQTEGECPDCENGQIELTNWAGSTNKPCPTCSGTGKEGEK